jgi:hypothetical protein
VYCPPGFTDEEDRAGNTLKGAWRSEVCGDEELTRFGQVGGNRYCRSAADIRELYRNFFLTTDGEVSWQYNHVHRTS